MPTFAERIREAMRTRRIKAPELSRISGVSQPYIYDLLMARAKNPSTDKMLALAKALDVDSGWLLSGSGEPPTKDSGVISEPPGEYSAVGNISSAARIAIQALCKHVTRDQIASSAAEVIGFKEVTNDPQAAQIVALLTQCAQKK